MQDYQTELSQFHDRFLSLEAELDLFEFTVDGVPIWERVREDLKITLLAENGLTGSNDPDGRGVARQLRGLYLMARNVVQHNPFFVEPSDIAFLGHPRRKQRSESWWDIYCDPLHRTDALDAVHLEPPWKFQHFSPTETPTVRYTDLIEYLGQTNTYFGFFGHDLSDAEKRRIEHIEDRFTATYGQDVDIRTRVREILDRRVIMKPLYTRLLARIDPELVVMVAHSGRETFIEACHDAGVPVAELQHGQISPYSYQHAFPGGRTKFMYPDYLLTFGEFWETAASLPIDSERVYPVGYPYLEREIERLRPFEQRQQVVFVSTPEAGPVLSEVAAAISTREDIEYDVVFKLHPDEFGTWESEYPWLVDAPVPVAGRNGPSLYDLFAESSVQVGVGSTALYEGLAFDLQTYLLRRPTIEWLEPVIESGGATVVESAADLAQQLTASVQSTAQPDLYFEPNGVENAVAVIEDLAEHGTVRKQVMAAPPTGAPSPE